MNGHNVWTVISTALATALVLAVVTGFTLLSTQIANVAQKQDDVRERLAAVEVQVKLLAEK